MWRFDEYDDVLSGESVGVVVTDEYPRREVFDNLGRSGRSGVDHLRSPAPCGRVNRA